MRLKTFEQFFNKIHESYKNEDDEKFKIGDVVVAKIIDDKKLPNEAVEFLKTYKEYVVYEVKENGKLNLGCKICHNEDGKEKDFLFSPKRFELKK